MNELARMIEAARQDVQVQWDPARQHRVAQGLGRKRRRRRVLRSSAAAFGVIAGVGLLWLGRDRLATRLDANSVASVSDSALPSVAFADGSRATKLTPNTELARVRDTPDAVAVELVQGRARFDVVHKPRRSFKVQAGDVDVFVVGTLFEVERDDQAVRVTVSRGLVRVLSGGQEKELAEGEEGIFAAAPSVVVDEPSSEKPDPVPETDAKIRRPSPWRALVKVGRYPEAYRALKQAGLQTVEDVPVVLMDAADAARLSGHPVEAATFLRRVVKSHAKDSLAPLAAFSLGRVLLEDLGQPADAARAFADARRVAPRGALAQDALAREVEGWSKAGDAASAHERAVEYVRSYPTGRRLRAVRTLGGLD